MASRSWLAALAPHDADAATVTPELVAHRHPDPRIAHVQRGQTAYGAGLNTRLGTPQRTSSRGPNRPIRLMTKH